MRYYFILICFLLPVLFYGQNTETEFQKIDSLFLLWNTPNHPGGAIAVMKGDKIIYSKAFGLASLEFLAPNSTETMFNTASVSKQFTAMGIVVLHLQNKLSVDDDIRKHLPDLPDFGEAITIRHMLHHTSGLRSLHALLELAGWRGDDSRTNEDLYRFLEKQKDLNFKPGDTYLYCNTGYMLMAAIIEKISGEKFTDWMRKNVFTPLGMTHTYVEENYQRVVPGNADSYYNTNSGFQKAIEYWGYVGSGNMHSTTNDLLVWLKNFYSPEPGWKEAFDMIQTIDNFNDGSPNNYAFGVNINKEFGTKKIVHGGSIGGFRSNIAVYPEKELGIAVLTNFSSSNPGGKIHQVAKILLSESLNNNEDQSTNNPKSVNYATPTLPIETLKNYEASYWQDDDNYSRTIYLKNDTLRYYRGENNESPIVPISKNVFKMLGVTVDLKVTFGKDENEQKTMKVVIDNDKPILSTQYIPREPTADQLKSYSGDYYSPELETMYTIYEKEGKIYWHHSRHGDAEMKELKVDVLSGEWPFVTAKVKRTEEGHIKGFYVSNGRVRNLWFEKRK